MIQLNLLPDVKLQYIKTRKNKRSIIIIASFVVIVSIGVTSLLFSFVYVGQRAHMKHLDHDIDSGIGTIQNTKGINEILTIQNQLGVLNAKHSEKPAITRALPYVAQMLPSGGKLTGVNVDFLNATMSIEGSTTDINATNKLVDTLKFAEYSTQSGLKGKPFSDVVLSSFSTQTGASSYSITMKFDPVLFKNTEEVTLTVPGIISTRSSTEKPVIEVDKKVEPSSNQTQGRQ